MGLFNSGKNEKVEKVNKYERHYNVPESSSRRRSSKHRPQQGESGGRAMSQPPMMRMGGAPGFFPAGGVFSPPVMGGMAPNVLPPVRFPVSPYDLSKFTPAAAAGYSANPFAAGQIAPMSFQPVWNNGMALVNQRSPFPQAFAGDYQQGWPAVSPSNYGYMPPMQF